MRNFIYHPILSILFLILIFCFTSVVIFDMQFFNLTQPNGFIYKFGLGFLGAIILGLWLFSAIWMFSLPILHLVFRKDIKKIKKNETRYF